jgi:hypothetical protein
LFPRDFRYRKVGGRVPSDSEGHRHIRDFWIQDFSEGVIPNHRSWNWAPERPLEIRTPEQAATFGPGYGRWRLEVEPSKPARTDYFLNVLRPSLAATKPLPEIERFETPGAYGAQISDSGRTFRVMFSKEALTPPVVDRP